MNDFFKKKVENQYIISLFALQFIYLLYILKNVFLRTNNFYKYKQKSVKRYRKFLETDSM